MLSRVGAIGLIGWLLAASSHASAQTLSANYPGDFQVAPAAKGAFLLRGDSKLFYCYFISGSQRNPSRCTSGLQLPREAADGTKLTYQITSDGRLDGALSVVSNSGVYYQCQGTPSQVSCGKGFQIPQ